MPNVFSYVTESSRRENLDIVMPLREPEETDHFEEQTRATTEGGEETAIENGELILEEVGYGKLVKTKPVIGSTINNEAIDKTHPHKRPPSNHPCTRCKQLGHSAQHCPTIGDPSYDPQLRLSNIPNSSRIVVQDLTGIDVTNKTVILMSCGIHTIDRVIKLLSSLSFVLITFVGCA